MSCLANLTNSEKPDSLLHHAGNSKLGEVVEQIRLSYVHVLKVYLLLLKRYKQMRENITDDGLKRNIHLLDNLFLDEKGKVSWDEIRKMIPPNLEKSIKNKYAMLNENEIKLCCLLLFEVTPHNISNILKISKDTVYVLKNKIKHKTGIFEIKEVLKYFLLDFE